MRFPFLGTQCKSDIPSGRSVSVPPSRNGERIPYCVFSHLFNTPRYLYVLACFFYSKLLCVSRSQEWGMGMYSSFLATERKSGTIILDTLKNLPYRSLFREAIIKKLVLAT